MRLDKYLGAAGLSRSEAREAIKRGRAAIDGRCVNDAGAQVAQGAPVTLDGLALGARGHVHLMMNKPMGVVTASRDKASGTVFDLLSAKYKKLGGLSAVGRLDRDTTGLLLFTTDGQLAHRLISPRFTVEKVYRASLDRDLSAEHIGKMAAGISLSDFTAKGARLVIESPRVGVLTVTEGKYHQVKRMFGSLALTVLALERLSVGGVALDPALAPGEVRPLTGEEKRRLYSMARLEEE